MLYLRAKIGGAIQYPYSIRDLVLEDPSIQIPGTPSEEWLAVFSIFPVYPQTPPTDIDSINKSLVEDVPKSVGNKWFQNWVVIDATDTQKQLAKLKIQTEIANRVQQRLDSFAQTRNYDNILSACTYATSKIPKFQAEGQACVDMRDTAWNILYSLIAEVALGTKPMPNSYTDIESLLPPLIWPT